MQSRLRSLRKFFSLFRSGTRSLKATLGLYFLPLSVLPALFLSFYAIRVYEENTREQVKRRAETERDAFVAEIQRLEKEMLDSARALKDNRRFLSALSTGQKNPIEGLLQTLPEHISARVYSPSGKYQAGHLAAWDHQISFISDQELERIKSRGETRDRFFRGEGLGIATVVRVLLRDVRKLYGVLELQTQMAQQELADFKSRRQIDSVLLTKDLAIGAASFALPSELVRSFSNLPFRLPGDPILVTIGDSRYSAFLYELPAAFSKKQKAGFFVLFLSLTAADAAAQKLRVALVYVTAFLVLTVAFLIFFLSNRIVEPVEMLVMGMKGIKAGRNAQIPPIDSPYEIEYLVHSFNEMARTIAEARSALETKVAELRKANSEIKDAQGVLIQSAKMASLGQLVAGVAHELNNPIGFISSNMHHLNEYVDAIRRLVSEYREHRETLPQADRARVEAIEKQLDIDFILKDMLDLTRSCVEGANRTKEIVLGLRTFSRMDESTFRKADLHDGIRSTLKLLITEIKDRVVIHEEFGPIPEVECNQSQINQVFMNLLSNSAQAIVGKGEIWIRTRRESDRVRIEVEDNGSGIPPQSLQKIFDPFFTTKTVGKGTGLGLSIAYGLIEKHHGSISVESEVGKGTRFVIYLPITQPTLRVSTEVG
jgi:two-component system, NtrC family, sensor kinase